MKVEVKNYRAIFNWTKQELLTLASNEALYSTRTAENPDIVSFTEDEKQFFDDNIADTVLSLTSLFWRIMDDSDTVLETSKEISFTLSLRNQYAAASLDRVCESATKFIVYTILQRWYSINNIAPITQLYTSKTAECVNLIQDTIFRFNRPNIAVAFEIIKP